MCGGNPAQPIQSGGGGMSHGYGMIGQHGYSGGNMYQPGLRRPQGPGMDMGQVGGNMIPGGYQHITGQPPTFGAFQPKLSSPMQPQLGETGGNMVPGGYQHITGQPPTFGGQQRPMTTTGGNMGMTGGNMSPMATTGGNMQQPTGPYAPYLNQYMPWLNPPGSQYNPAGMTWDPQ